MPTTGEIQNMMAGISFRDVEESLNKFRGQPFEDLDEWVAEYEDIAVTCNWTPTQKYLFARRLLDGPARKAVRANKTIKNYETSLAHLKEEHPNTASTSQIHDILTKKKKQSTESYIEYMYDMKEIGQSKMDEKSLVKYIVGGLPESYQNKVTLFEAKTLKELKEKLVVFELNTYEREKTATAETRKTYKERYS